MSRPTVVGTGPIDPIAAEILKPFGEIVIAPDPSEEALVPLLDKAVALVVRGDGKAGSRVIGAAPNLKVIGRTGVGYDNVDICAATSRAIPVVYTPGAGARAVAEGTVSLMLALCKNLFYWDTQLKAGNWQSRYQSVPGDLDGATLGIVGFGATGQMLAELVRPFNMSVIAYDPYAPEDRARELTTTLTGLEGLLQRSDFISIHAPMTEETRGLISRDRLEIVKPGDYLINMARGGLIESLDALHDALQAGKLAGVALDVFDPEPPDVSHPIFKLPNCLTTPHALGMSRGAMARVFRSMAEDVAAILSGERPRFVVNPEVLQ